MAEDSRMELVSVASQEPLSPSAATEAPKKDEKIVHVVEIGELEVTHGDAYNNSSLLRHLRPKLLSDETETQPSLLPKGLQSCIDYVDQRTCPNSCARGLVLFFLKCYLMGLFQVLLIFYSEHQGDLYVKGTPWAAWCVIPLAIGVELVGIMELLRRFVGPRLEASEPARVIVNAWSSGGNHGVTLAGARITLVATYYAVYYFTFLTFYVVDSWSNDLKDPADAETLPISSILWWYCGPQFFMALFVYSGGTLFFVCVYVLFLECIKWQSEISERREEELQARRRRAERAERIERAERAAAAAAAPPAAQQAPVPAPVEADAPPAAAGADAPSPRRGSPRRQQQRPPQPVMIQPGEPARMVLERIRRNRSRSPMARSIEMGPAHASASPPRSLMAAQASAAPAQGQDDTSHVVV